MIREFQKYLSLCLDGVIRSKFEAYKSATFNILNDCKAIKMNSDSYVRIISKAFGKTI